MKANVISAVNLTRQAIESRLAYFTKIGQDLRKEPDFKNLQNRQEGLIDDYCKRIKKDDIIADKKAEENILRLMKDIKESGDTDSFIKKYQDFIAFIESRLSN